MSQLRVNLQNMKINFKFPLLAKEEEEAIIVGKLIMNLFVKDQVEAGELIAGF